MTEAAAVSRIAAEREAIEKRESGLFAGGVVYAEEEADAAQLLCDVVDGANPEAAALAAIKAMGLALLDPGITRERKSDAARLHEVVWAYVRGWYRIARRPDSVDGARAATHLKDLGRIITSKRRHGKNTAAAHPVDVFVLREDRIHRLGRARLLAKELGPRHHTRIAEGLGIPPQYLQELLGTGRLKDTVNAWTAADFNITPEAVPNLMARHFPRKPRGIP